MLEGKKELLNKLNSLDDIILESVIKSVITATDNMYKDLNDNTPVDTGEAKSRNQKDVAVKDRTVEGTVSNDTEYFPYFELGTGDRGAASTFKAPVDGLSYTPGYPGQRAQAPMYKAYISNRDKSIDLISKGLKDDLNKLQG